MYEEWNYPRNIFMPSLYLINKENHQFCIHFNIHGSFLDDMTIIKNLTNSFKFSTSWNVHYKGMFLNLFSYLFSHS